MKPFIDMVEESGFDTWSYPFAYGALTNRLRAYLRGECSREELTAFFAQVDMIHEAFTAAVALNLGPESIWEVTKQDVRRRLSTTDPVTAQPGGASPAE